MLLEQCSPWDVNSLFRELNFQNIPAVYYSMVECELPSSTAPYIFCCCSEREIFYYIVTVALPYIYDKYCFSYFLILQSIF